jgi:hypothetical protein
LVIIATKCYLLLSRGHYLTQHNGIQHNNK